MSKRLGFVSATGILVAVIALAGVLAWTLVKGPVLFSPGGLNAEAKAEPVGGVASHADLAGDCGACHPAPWSSETMTDRCLACHTDVGDQIKNKSGLHGKMLGSLSSPTCRGCHPEHNGANGALTVTDATGFPHDETGFSLEQHTRTEGGARFTCADCHPKDLAQFDQATCSACHAEMDAAFMRRHEAAFGKDCLMCHHGRGGGTSVDHSKFAFKLEGKHAEVACDGCHAGAKTLQDFQQTPQDCYSCHAKDDEHQGGFGRQCEDCHNPTGWGDVNFDHSIFPVDHGSEERKPACATCHPKDTSTYTCYGCHEHTTANVVRQHEGKTLAELQDCVRCHEGGRSEGGD